MTIVHVVGDANVDLEIRLPETATASVAHANPEPQMFGGGSASNTAAALARLGVACRFIGAVGDDAFGRFAVASLEAAGVDVRAVQTTRQSATVAVIAVVRPDGDRLIYVWPPAGGAHTELSPASAIDGLADAAWLHVSGICLRLAPARQAVLAAMDRAKEASVPISFDLNLRLENWGWDNGFRSVVAAAIDRCDVVVGGAADEVAAVAGVSDPVEAAMSLASENRLVIARLGSEGAVACSRTDVIREGGFEVAAVDTVGAGDAFNAGLIAAWLRGHGVKESLRWANAVAALTITEHGARSSPTFQSLQELLDSSPGA